MAVQRRADLGGARLQHGLPVARLRRDHARHAVLQDAGLLERDLRHRLAQEMLMVERDRRDRGDGGARDHVGGVEPPAQSDLGSSVMLGRRARLEGEEGRRRRDLEEGHGRAVIDALALLEERQQQVLVDEAAGDPDAPFR